MVSGTGDIVSVDRGADSQGGFKDAVGNVVGGFAVPLGGVQQVVEHLNVIVVHVLQEGGCGAPGHSRPRPGVTKRLGSQPGSSALIQIMIVYCFEQLARQRGNIPAPSHVDGGGHERCAPGMAGHARVSVGAPGIFPVTQQLRPGRHVLGHPIYVRMFQCLSDPRIRGQSTGPLFLRPAEHARHRDPVPQFKDLASISA